MKRNTMMLKPWLLSLLVVFAWIDATTVTAAPLRVGVFDVDISPPVGSPLAYDPCVGVAMSLRATGVVILGNDAPVVLCAVDWIGIANDAHHEWRRRIAIAAKTDRSRVTVHTLHQHDAPFCDYSSEAILTDVGLSGIQFDIKFSQDAIDRVSAAVAKASESAAVVTHMGIGEAEVENVASNRRILGDDGKVKATRYTACRDPLIRAEPEGIVDRKLRCISFWNDEKPIAVMTYFATHPQSYYREGIANPDFPGMARHLRQVTLNGLPHIHFNGAGGNIGAGKYNDGSPDNRQVLAQRMANGMAAAWKETERTPVTAEQMDWQVESIAIEAAPHLQESGLMKIIGDTDQAPLNRSNAARDLAWLRRCERQETVDVTCLRLGPASILHVPGEAVVEYQLAAQAFRPDRFLAVAAYGDYGPGYICLTEHYAQGGYEASPLASRVSPNTEPILKRAIQNVLVSTDKE